MTVSYSPLWDARCFTISYEHRLADDTLLLRIFLLAPKIAPSHRLTTKDYPALRGKLAWYAAPYLLFFVEGVTEFMSNYTKQYRFLDYLDKPECQTWSKSSKPD